MKAILKIIIILLIAKKSDSQDEIFIDTSFANEGHSYINLAANNHPNSVMCNADGNIFIAGFSEIPGAVLLAKLTPDGNRDSTFSDDGLFVFSSDTCNQAYCAKVDMLPNGKIILVATVWQGATFSTSQEYLIVLRINQDGTLDESFGNSGVSQLAGPFYPVYDILIAENEIVYISCGLYPDANDVTRSKIYKLNELDYLEEFGAETISSISPESSLYLTRMEFWNNEILCADLGGLFFKIGADGQLITSFGTDGFLQISNDGYIGDISLLESGQVLALQTGLPSKLVRLNQNGTLDENYGINGEFILSNSEDCCRFIRLIKHPSGNIILAGHSSVNCDNYTAYSTHFAQLNGDGEQVPMYVIDGSIDITWGSYYNGVFTIQPNGKIIFSGSRFGTSETQLDFHTMRIDPSTVLSVSPLHSNLRNRISIAPNPANNIAHVNFSFKLDYTPPMNSELVIIDVQGREVMRQRVLLFGQSDALFAIDVSKISSGIYTVHWVSEFAWLNSVKLVKE